MKLDYGDDSYDVVVVQYPPFLTHVLLRDGDGMVPVFATAECHPKDQFSRKRGRKLAFKRLLSSIGYSREQRKEAWRKWFEKFPKDNKS